MTFNPAFDLNFLTSTINKYQKAKAKLEEEQDVITIRQILSNFKDYPLDVIFLAGTAFSSIKNDREQVFSEIRESFGELHQLSLLYGAFSYVRLNMLVCDSADDEDRIKQLLSRVSELLKSHEFVYHKLRLLMLFAKNLKISNSSRESAILQDLKDVFEKNKYLFFIASNFEAQEPGVSEAAKEALKAWICLLSTKSNEVAETIFKNTVSKLTWASRSRYILLGLTVPYVDPKTAIVHTNGVHPNGLCSRIHMPLGDNLLSSVGADMHLATLKSWGKEAWFGYFSGRFVENLLSSNEVVVENAVNLYLPQILTVIPESAEFLIGKLDPSNPSHWLGICTVLKLAQEKELLNPSLKELAETLIPKAMCYSEDIVRVRAFSYFTYSKKKTEPFTAEQLATVLQFYEDNLNSDYAPFRQQLSSVTKNVTDRVVESSLSCLRLKKFDDLGSSVGFLDSWISMLFENLNPGANYQRLSTCLDFLNILLGVLFTDRKELSKGSELTAKPALIEHARNLGKFQFFETQNFEILKKCCQVTFSDVREKSANLLANFFAPSDEQLQRCTETAETLCNSPRFTESECGALFSKLVAQWLLKRSEQDYGNFVKSLIARANKQFSGVKEDFLLGAREAPLQGTILSLRRVICEVGDGGVVSKVELETLVNFAEEVVEHMLDRLACKAAGPKDVPPSFGEMSESVEEIIRISTGKTNGHVSSVCSDEEFNVEISDDHQVILACAWLNLKESAMLAAYLVERFHSIMSPELTGRFGDVILKVMTRCRHKGAIESGAVACAIFCRTLSDHPSESHNTLPYKQLEYVINLLESSTSAASITRRSAGLALVVLKIVSAGNKASKKRHVKYAMERLIHIAEKESISTDANLDIVQAQALHIIKSLVEDASISLFVYPYCSKLFRLCVEHFSSEFWTVRNASLQLYGGLVLRLIGQKKVNNQGAASMTTFDFLYRNQEIAAVILEKLSQSATELKSPNPSLVPLLSLLARLSPGFETDFDEKLCAALRQLMGHVEYKVRELAARALVAFVRYYDVPVTIVNECARLGELLNGRNTNLVHGYLIFLSVLTNRLVDLEVLPRDKFERNYSVNVEIQALRPRIMHYPYLVLNEYYKIYKTLNIPLSLKICDVLNMYNSEKAEPGFGVYLATLVEIYLNHVPDNQAVTFPRDFRGEDPVPKEALLVWLAVMKQRIPKMAKSSIAAVQAVDVLICLMKHECDSEIILKGLQILEIRGIEFIVKEPELREHVTECMLEKASWKDCHLAAVAMRLLAELVTKLREIGEALATEQCEKYKDLAWAYIHPSSAFPLRFSVARMLSLAGPVLSRENLQDGELALVKFALILLQDDAKEIRTEVTKFVRGLLREEFEKSPTLAIKSLLKLLKAETKQDYESYVGCIVSNLKSVACATDSNYLFSPEPLNPYMEVGIFQKLANSVP